MLPEVVIGASAASWDQVEHAGMNQNQQSTQYHDGHADALDHLDDVLDIVIETQGTCPRSSSGPVARTRTTGSPSSGRPRLESETRITRRGDDDWSRRSGAASGQVGLARAAVSSTSDASAYRLDRLTTWTRPQCA